MTPRIRDIDRTIRWTSIRHVLKKAIKEKNLSAIRDELSGLMAEEGLDFLTIGGPEGNGHISDFIIPRDQETV